MIYHIIDKSKPVTDEQLQELSKLGLSEVKVRFGSIITGSGPEDIQATLEALPYVKAVCLDQERKVQDD